MTVAITRLDLTEADLRALAARTQDARSSRRMLAIALLLEGWSRESAGLGASLQCLWVGRAVQPGAPQRATASPVKRTRGHGGGMGGARS